MALSKLYVLLFLTIIKQYYELQEPHQVLGFGGFKKNTLSKVTSFNLSLISFTDLFSQCNDIKKFNNYTNLYIYH